MAAISQILITHIKSATHGTNVLKGVVSAQLRITETIKEGASDGVAGVSSQDNTFTEIAGTLELESEAQLISALGYAQADLAIVGHIGGGTTDRTVTIKNVVFRASAFNWPAVNANENGKISVDFKATWDKVATAWRTLYSTNPMISVADA